MIIRWKQSLSLKFPAQKFYTDQTHTQLSERLTSFGIMLSQLIVLLNTPQTSRQEGITKEFEWGLQMGSHYTKRRKSQGQTMHSLIQSSHRCSEI